MEFFRRSGFQYGRIIVALLVGATVSACGDDKSASENQAPPPSVVVTAAAMQDITRSVEFIGRVSAIDDVSLVARVSGFLQEKNIKDGALVEKGQLLFTLEKTSYEAALLSSKADLADAKAESALKAADLLRDQDLFKQGHVSKAKLDASIAARDKADARVDAANAAVTKAELDVSYTDMKAPFAGQVGKTAFSVGDVVGPTHGPIASLVRLAPVYVDFSVSEKVFLNVAGRGGLDPETLAQRETDTTISLVLPNGKPYDEPGRVVFIDNKVDAKTGTIAIRVQFPNAGTVLVPGTFVTVVLTDSEASRALTIPQAAIQRDQKGSFVLAINSEEMVEQRHVELGEPYESGFEVTAGLQEGERVIVQGLQKVRPGVPVNAVVGGQPIE